MVKPHVNRLFTRNPKPFLGILFLAVLAFPLAACGGSGSSTSPTSSPTSASSNPSTATVYLDEIEGNKNGQDTPALDKFWWSNSKTDTKFTTSYNVSIAPGGKLTVNNEGNDQQKITITGPSNYSKTYTVAGSASVSIVMPSTKGTYTFISDPTTAPARPGARGGIIKVA